jgi:exodeoxyribonuclease V alpha subunit
VAFKIRNTGGRAPDDPRARQLRGRVDNFLAKGTNLDGRCWYVAALDNRHTVKGTTDPDDTFNEGEYCLFYGRWGTHGKYGDQFKADSFERLPAIGREAIIRYLADTAHHIGTKLAKKCWEVFGEDAIDVVATDPKRVEAAGILNEKKAREAAESLSHDAVATVKRNLTIKLRDLFYGTYLPTDLPRRLVGDWGSRAWDIINKNPFRLLIDQYDGCGFTLVDRLYQRLGLPLDALKRQGLLAWREMLTNHNGNVWHTVEGMIGYVQEKVPGGNQNPRRSLQLMTRAGWLVRRSDDVGGEWLALAEWARAEMNVARRLHELMVYPARWPRRPLVGVSMHQQERWAVLQEHPIGLLLGPPGVGKTFTEVMIIKLVIEVYGADAVIVAAPTGKAAARLNELLAKAGLTVRATTIHRMLSAKTSTGDTWTFAYNHDNPLPAMFVFIDEASMIDASLLSHLLDALRHGANLLLTGDQHQLPSVQPGAPLRDLIAAGLPHAQLSEILRNAGDIVYTCERIRTGRDFEPALAFDDAAGRNLVYVPATPSERVAVVLDLVRGQAREGNWNVIEDIQVLTAKNDLRKQLNHALQNALNPDGKKLEASPFRLGDKIINTKNKDYELAHTTNGEKKGERIANGEMGIVIAFEGRVMIVRMLAGGTVVKVPVGSVHVSTDDDDDNDDGERYERTGCKWLLGYALTVHKAQGSEWPAVIAVTDVTAGKVAGRGWWYTGLSRAKARCAIVGDMDVVRRQCRRDDFGRRKTFLVELLTCL